MSEKIKYTIDVDGNAKAQLDEAAKSIDNFKKKIEAPIKELPLTRQIRDIKIEMAKLDQAGMGGSKAFLDLAKKAGSIRDSITAANDQIKTMAVGSNLEKNINFARGAFDALNGSAQIVTSSMAIFGFENENVAKSIQKMVALTTLANGVSTIHKALIKEGALMTGLMAMKTNVATAAQTVYTAAVGASTGALKAFKIAMASTGILALIAAAGTLMMAFSAFNDEADEARTVLENQKTATDNLASSLLNLSNAYDQSLDARLRAEGKSEEADATKLKSLREQKSALESYISSVNTYSVNEDAERKLQENDIWSMETVSAREKRIEDAKKADKKFLEDRKSAAKLQVGIISNQQATIRASYDKSPNSTIKKTDTKLSTSATDNSNKLINNAPKTFNVYINELGNIDTVNLISDEDEEAFAKKLKNALLGALTTISVQAT